LHGEYQSEYQMPKINISCKDNLRIICALSEHQILMLED